MRICPKLSSLFVWPYRSVKLTWSCESLSGASGFSVRPHEIGSRGLQFLCVYCNCSSYTSRVTQSELSTVAGSNLCVIKEQKSQVTSGNGILKPNRRNCGFFPLSHFSFEINFSQFYVYALHTHIYIWKTGFPKIFITFSPSLKPAALLPVPSPASAPLQNGRGCPGGPTSELLLNDPFCSTWRQPPPQQRKGKPGRGSVVKAARPNLMLVARLPRADPRPWPRLPPGTSWPGPSPPRWPTRAPKPPPVGLRVGGWRGDGPHLARQSPAGAGPAERLAPGANGLPPPPPRQRRRRDSNPRRPAGRRAGGQPAPLRCGHRWAGRGVQASRRAWRGRCGDGAARRAALSGPAGGARPTGPESPSHALRDWATVSRRPMGGVGLQWRPPAFSAILPAAGGAEEHAGRPGSARPRHAALPGLGGVHARCREALPRRPHEGGVGAGPRGRAGGTEKLPPPAVGPGRSGCGVRRWAPCGGGFGAFSPCPVALRGGRRSSETRRVALAGARRGVSQGR